MNKDLKIEVVGHVGVGRQAIVNELKHQGVTLVVCNNVNELPEVKKVKEMGVLKIVPADEIYTSGRENRRERRKKQRKRKK